MTTQCIDCGFESERLVLPGTRSDRLWHAVKQWWTDRRKRSLNRQAIKYLRTLDDALLKDIGVSRADVEWAGKLPTSSDATTELEIIARGGYGGFSSRGRSGGVYRR